jgi:ribonuclease J
MQELTYIPMGGAGRVTQNMHVFESENDILIVDVGIGMPEADQFGVDVVIPDVSYLKAKQNKIRGILITHAHEDHIGGLPYILKEIGTPPIWAAKLPRGFIQNKLAEHNLLHGQTINLIEPEKGLFKIGEFEVNPYRVNHSVPDALGFFIRTPIGNFVYSPDFKFDWTPVDGNLFEIGKLSSMAQEGVLGLFSDCLGSNREGYTASERKIQFAFEREMEGAPSQVFISTVSSNISRMQQAINASIKYNRRVVPVGRSIEKNMEIARNLGYLKAPDGIVVPLDRARKIPPRRITYIIAGSYGQKGSALDRVARAEHRQIRMRDDAVVIFSADPIPGIIDQVNIMIDTLTERGARVVYSEVQDDLHVSGHGSQGDLSTMIGITRPKYFVPLGGTARHQRAYAGLVENMGFDSNNVFELRAGQTVRFKKDHAELGEKVETRDVFVDGGLVGDVGRIVLEDRMQMAAEGVCVIAVRKDREGKLDPRIEASSRGFIFMFESGDLVKKVNAIGHKIIRGKRVSDWNGIKEKLDRELTNFFYRKIKRKPLILPVLVNTDRPAPSNHEGGNRDNKPPQNHPQ